MQAELVLYPSRKKWIGVSTIGLFFAAAGVWIRNSSQFAGWFVLVFGAFCAAVGAGALLPRSGHLRLTREGFEQRSLFRTHFEPWHHIEYFEAYQNRTGGPRMVGLKFRPEHAATRRGVRVSQALAGQDGAIADTYGMSADDLAALMNEWLRRAESS